MSYSAIACQAKDALTEQQAQRIASNMRRRDQPVSAYKCSACGSWHVGNRPKSLRGARPAYRPKR